jgi:hypothetical protein
MEQAMRDGLIERNPARVTGWQRQYQRAEDELDDPRSLTLPHWDSLTELTAALIERSAGKYAGWGEIVVFAACTAARIGEVSGVRAGDIDRETWTWTVRRQTTPAPGGLLDKGTKGKRARKVPMIDEVRESVGRLLDNARGEADARLFTGPRGGRISTAVLRDATHWDEVVSQLGYEHLRRARSPAHRAHVDGRRRGSGPRPTEDRTTWLAFDHSAVPPPGCCIDHRSWRIPERSPEYQGTEDNWRWRADCKGSLPQPSSFPSGSRHVERRAAAAHAPDGLGTRHMRPA